MGLSIIGTDICYFCDYLNQCFNLKTEATKKEQCLKKPQYLPPERSESTK